MFRSLKICLCAIGICLAGSAAAAAEFTVWLEALKAEALGKGIKQATLDDAFAGVRPIPRVIELDRNQPEFKLTFEQYMSRVVPRKRVEKGRRLRAENKALLDAVSAKFGVQARFLVALWGIESDFGRLTGGFRVIPALATLAHDGRRGKFFRSQLFHALRIIDQGHIAARHMMGSWAGAMGQVQFMPSSFNNFAFDFDGDGRKDLWTTPGDIFASAANYLARSGWRGDKTWGRKVTLPADFDRSQLGLKRQIAMSEWQALGVRRANGGDLPKVEISASLITPTDKALGPPFLVYENYRTILKWNRSHFFALAVGRLADLIGDQ